MRMASAGSAVLQLAAPEEGLNPEQLSAIVHHTFWCASWVVCGHAEPTISHHCVCIGLHDDMVTDGETCSAAYRAGASVRLLDLSRTCLTHRSFIGSTQLYGLRPAAQRAGGGLQTLILARCGLTPSMPPPLLAMEPSYGSTHSQRHGVSSHVVCLHFAAAFRNSYQR